ncbi:MAG: lamin tail domain-containing protein, partial [Phycisphaerae bacterium]|nr:lamin tail domain-containing protein [Phycisphaerae bacterium]
MHSFVKSAVFGLALALSLVNSAQADCPIGSLNGDCEVDWADMQILAANWLEPSGAGSVADLDGVNGVNMGDFCILAGNWCVAPQGSGSLRVGISPPGALNGGAKWQVNDRPWRSSGYTESDLSAGFHAVEFEDIAGWEKPAKMIVQIENGQTVHLSLIYARQLVINEFLAINDRILEDPCEAGEFPDWIEIYNPTEATISLGGWYLANWNRGSSDPDLTDWQFPDGIEIDAGDFRVVFASDKDIRDPNAPYLHTSFKLAQNDECLALVAPDGNTIVHQYAPYPQQLSDISYGLAQYAADEMPQQYFAEPTPGKPNKGGEGEQVGKVWFSHERGLYDAPFALILSTETTGLDVKIMYTTDGSRPSATRGNIYNPNSPLTVDETTIIRAVAVKPGRLDSHVETHTYIFLDDVRYQSLAGAAPGPNWPAGGYFNGQRMDYGMDRRIVSDDPTYADHIIDALKAIGAVSLVTDLKNLFDPATGIYVNASREGREWERPCSLELIYPPNPRGPGFPDLAQVPDANGGYRWDLPGDMRGGFQIDAGVRIRGGYSVVGDNPKHALRFFFRSTYGPANLGYRLFGDEGEDVYDHIDLRCSQNYSWASEGHLQNTNVRDVFSRDIQGAAGRPYTRSRYYHLYINGCYWGLFQTQERSEASFAESYMGGVKEDYDVVNSKLSAGRRILPTDGARDSLDRLYYETIAGFDNYERYYRVQGLNMDGTPNSGYERLLDVENLIDFMIIEYYTGDRDGPGSRFGTLPNKPNNTWGIYNRENPDGWKWLHHDNEHTIGTSGSDENMVTPFTTAGADIDYFNPHWLHEQLVSANIDYRMQFADRVNQLFTGLLSLDSARYYVQERANQIDMAIIAESARWGDSKRGSPLTKAHWQTEIDRILYSTIDNRCLPNRAGVVLDQFKSAGWFPGVKPPTFTSFADYLFMNNPNGAGTTYYTLNGVDPRIPAAQSAPGGEGDVHPDALMYGVHFPIEKTTQVKARVWFYGTWSALAEATYTMGPIKENLRITEIMYHPKDANDPNDPNEEFIELKNIGTKAININLVRFTEGIDFTFGDIELDRGQYVVVVGNRAAFDARYPGSTALVAGEYSARLENRGERIRLEDAAGRRILDFDYEDRWRDITDGGGFSLTIIDPTTGTDNWGRKDCWRASAYEGGSPGAGDSGVIPDPGAIVINEVLAHSHGVAADWIELYNTTGSAVDIGGWYLSDNDANLMKYRIADGTAIGGHDYVVFYEDTDFNHPGEPDCIIPFALSENGEMVCLSSAEGAAPGTDVLTGYRDIERFGASATGVSFGRYPKSTGTHNFVPMDRNTPWLPNAYPKVGPIVISEIMYNPQSGDQKQEFIEVHNFGSSDVTLYDSNEGLPWKFTDGIDYTFPDYPGLTIPAGGYVLVVKDISAYIAEYGLPPFGVMVLGPYDGKLSNAGERLELGMPGDVDEQGRRRYIRAERVNYSDGSHNDGFEHLAPPLDPWP